MPLHSIFLRSARQFGEPQRSYLENPTVLISLSCLIKPILIFPYRTHNHNSQAIFFFYLENLILWKTRIRYFDYHHGFDSTTARISFPHPQNLSLLELRPPWCIHKLHLSHTLSPSNPFALWFLPHPPPRHHNRSCRLRLCRRILRKEPVVRSTHDRNCPHRHFPRISLCSHLHQHVEFPLES